MTLTRLGATRRAGFAAIERVLTWRFVRFNWLTESSGTAEQRVVIAKAVEVVRGEHPYVR